MANSTAALDELVAVLPGARRNESLRRYTSIRVGGPADIFFNARTSEDLVRAVSRAGVLGVPWRVIGSASNLLVSDDGIAGLVVKASTTNVVELPEPESSDVLVTAEAGCMIAAVGKQAATRGLGGLEWATNVPGTVGASVVNNSGAFGSSVAEHLVTATVYVPGAEKGALSVNTIELGYAYRTSRLKRGELAGVVLDATYRLTRGDAEALRARIAEIERTRRATQPTGYSVGSVFANPPGDASGRMIEAAGLKGFTVGDAQVSTLHANFIVNRGKASARDVLNLIKHVQETVWRQTGPWLTPEVQLAVRFALEDTRPLSAPPGAAA